MKKKLRKLITVVMAAAVVTTCVSAGTVMAGASEADTAGQNNAQVTAWADDIDEMLDGQDYVEGEVIAVFNNTAAKNAALKKIDQTSDLEQMAEVSSDAVEETFDVDVKDSDSAAVVELITSDTKTTRQLLEELAGYSSVIYAAPNYISYNTDYEESSESSETSTTVLADETTAAADDGNTELQKAVLPAGRTDLIETQGYDSVGDLSYLQWGYGTNSTGLYTISSPLWNKTNTDNISNKTPVVAVIDSGIDYTHPEFDGIIEDMSQYSNKGGKNGYNCSGVGKEDDVMDDNGHGTHCAGIIAAKWDGTGVSGVASGVKLAIVRCSAAGAFADANTVKAFLYLKEAVEKGLNLYSINCSFGGDGFSNVQLLMINELGQLGVVTCVASGNSSYDNDDYSNTSADHSVSQYVVEVNASAAAWRSSDYTCYGQTTTDVYSPGDAILSPVCESSAIYVAAIDKNRAYYDSFDTETAEENQVQFSYYGIVDITETETYKFEDQQAFIDFVNSAQANGSRIADSSDFDQNGYSYELTVPALDSTNKRAVFIASVPVSEDSFNDIANAAFALKSSLERVQTYVRPIKFDINQEDSYSSSVSVAGTDGWQRPSQVWTNMSVALNDSEGAEGETPFVYYKGRLYFIIMVSDSDASNAESKLYVDSVGMGKSVLRYAFYQGTSMATPAITGATAVMYDKLISAGSLDGLSASEKAVYVANTMKASVISNDDYTDMCTSNGAFSFTVAKADYTPVINTITENKNTVSLIGQYFGKDKGTVSFNDKECSIVSWTDTEITFTLPEGQENGRFSLDVTAANGKTTTSKVVLSQQDGRKVFENKVTMPEEIANCDISSMTVMDGILYVIPQVNSGKYVKSFIQNQLWSYNPKTDTWKRCEDIPIDEAVLTSNLKFDQTTQITSYNGYIVANVCYKTKEEADFEAYDNNFTNCAEWANDLYFYDPKTDTWVKADLGNNILPMQGRICGTDYGLFYFGGDNLVVKTEDVYSAGFNPEVIGTVDHNAAETAATIYRLEFSGLTALSDDETNVVLSEAIPAGTIQGTYVGIGEASTYGNEIAIVSNYIERLTWSEADKQFTSVYYGQIPEDMQVVGGEHDAVGYIADFAGTLTPDGLLITALNGDNYTGRGYDSFYYDTEGNIIPFEKNAALADLYAPVASYGDGYLFVWGDYFYNADSTIGYLAYTKIGEEISPEPSSEETEETEESTEDITSKETGTSTDTAATDATTGKGNSGKTGDARDIWIPIVILCAAVGAAAVSSLGLRKRRNR